MCSLPTLLLSTALAGGWTTPHSSKVTPEFVNAVAMAESNMDDCAVGDGGRARTAWQIWPSAWQTANQWRASQGKKQYPRSAMKDQRVAREMATSLLEWHENQLRKSGIANPDEGDIYMSYAMGFEGFKRIQLNRFLAPPHKMRALVRMRAALMEERLSTQHNHDQPGTIPRQR